MHYKKCLDAGGDIHIVHYYKSRTTPVGKGLPSPVMLLFSCLVHSVMPVIDKKPVSVDNDDMSII